MEEEKGRVCVTGGTGFIGSWLIMRLLDHGYSVRTTVRSDPEQKRDLSFLTNLPRASERLQIFNADLNNPESFDAAIAGCTGVIHVAAPIDIHGKEPEEVIIQRAVSGTIGILKSCLKSGTVKRVVYTSSASTVHFSGKDVDMLDETFWSDVDYIRKLDIWGKSYKLSKTLTERTALEFAEEHGLDLVTIIPSFVTGPFICPQLAGSVRGTLAMVMGNREEYSMLLNISMVHIDDVARAHIFLLEYPDVKGRYICSSATLTIQEMAEFLSAKYPGYPIPNFDSLAKIEGYKLSALSSKKLLDTGFTYKYGIDEMFDGAIQCCKEKGYL
ncbi:protein BRI1-5 ENHANCED 1 [Citrus sinensis]|uniref:Protein BRI1-5 ENHANCED 1 n=1 Tax=Citrus sinensis TaxID=2711 RepID=A0ACB8IJL5_CITSI|nr:protein BRI1-5 ENHANCED 1 [Citrus sinensis]